MRSPIENVPTVFSSADWSSSARFPMTSFLRELGHESFEEMKYVSLPPPAATATGFGSVHPGEQVDLVQKFMQTAPIKFP